MDIITWRLIKYEGKKANRMGKFLAHIIEL